MMSMLARGLVLACLLAAVTVPAAQGRPDGFRPGLYTCYASNVNVAGGLVYHGSMVLRRGGTYAFAYSLKGRMLVKPRTGTYRASASRITFTSGILASFYGVRVDASKFVEHLKSNRRTFAWCYFK